MSYDLYLVPKDDDPAAAYERLEQEAEREPTPEEEARLRRLAADLQVANSGLDISEPDSGFLLQLGYDTERPVVIDISAGEITMSWSYGAENRGRRLRRCAATSQCSNSRSTAWSRSGLGGSASFRVKHRSLDRGTCVRVEHTFDGRLHPRTGL